MAELYAKAIVNPAAGSYSVGRQWQLIKRQLQKTGVSFDHEFTKNTGHALNIATRAIRDGNQYLIAVGGDGTVNEVANGILRSANPLSITLGIVSAGTAHAFAASFDGTKNYNDINSNFFLFGNKRALIDVGMIHCSSHGQIIERFFLNEASIGLAAEIVGSWKPLSTHFGSSVNIALRTVAGYKALAVHRNKNVRLLIGNQIEQNIICTVVMSNGRYCADKMLMAPHASLDDGLLDAIIVGDISKFELLKIRPALYNGNHVKHSKIREIKTTTVSVESDERMLVEADGDIIGECPATFQVMLSILNVVVF